MTEFRLVPAEAHSSGSFALPRSPAGVPTGGFCYSARFRSGTPCPTPGVTYARRVLHDLSGLLDTTTYPNPLNRIARGRAQRHFTKPPGALLRVDSHRLMAGESSHYASALSRRGRRASMRSFSAGGGGCVLTVGQENPTVGPETACTG